jgi:hypothetical protein
LLDLKQINHHVGHKAKESLRFSKTIAKRFSKLQQNLTHVLDDFNLGAVLEGEKKIIHGEVGIKFDPKAPTGLSGKILDHVLDEGTFSPLESQWIFL